MHKALQAGLKQTVNVSIDGPNASRNITRTHAYATRTRSHKTLTGLIHPHGQAGEAKYIQRREQTPRCVRAKYCNTAEALHT